MEIIPSVAVPNSIIFLIMITNCVRFSPRLFLLCHRGSLEFQDIRSSERKLSYRFQLCNLRKAERRDWRFWWRQGQLFFSLIPAFGPVYDPHSSPLSR